MPYARTQDRAEYERTWRAANQDKVRASRKRWAAANPEKITAYRQTPGYKARQSKNGKIWWLRMTPDQVKMEVFRRAKKRAKRLNLEFTITITDLAWPAYCPVLGIALDYSPMGKQPAANSTKNPAVPSIDRTDSSRGYIPGNVQVLSWRANNIKRDSTVDELRKLVTYLEIVGEK